MTGTCNMQCVLRFPTELINSFYSYQVQKLSSDRHWAGLGWAGLSDLGTVRPGDGRVKPPWEDKLQGAQVALTSRFPSLLMVTPIVTVWGSELNQLDSPGGNTKWSTAEELKHMAGLKAPRPCCTHLAERPCGPAVPRLFKSLISTK